MQKFYFTYGTSEQYPYKGGWTEVIAETKHMAILAFKVVHPDVHEGILNCASVYTEEEFTSSGMTTGNYGACRHETIILSQIVKED